MTLDYAHADWAISKAAAALGHTQDAAVLLNRSQGWRNVFDAESGFMKPKQQSGSFEKEFDQWAWGGAYVEGGPWQYRFGVPWDPAGLADAYGGKEKLLAALDSVFTTPPTFHVGSYGQEIHEMTEMALESTRGFKFGQYEHNNQPVHHELYMFGAGAGCPGRTQYWVRETLTRLYTRDTFCGDEDNGEMASWYVLSALGLYGLAPGSTEFVLGSPLFGHVQVQLPGATAGGGSSQGLLGSASSVAGGPVLDIVALNNSKTNMYVQSVTWNGNPVAGNSVEYSELRQGGRLEFTMGPSPPEGKC